MALKTVIYENCRRCGEPDGKVQGTRVWRNTHRCKKPVPGPQAPPQDFRLVDVVFVRADGTRIVQ